MSPIAKMLFSMAILLGMCDGWWVPIAAEDETNPLGSDAVSAEAKERAAWEAFAKSLDTRAFAEGQADPLRDLDSGDRRKIVAALNALGSSGAIEAIPYIVPFLDSQEPTIRVHAGLNLKHVVSGIELKRRDTTQPGRIVFRPRTGGDPDLTSLRWVLRRMLTSKDDGNSAAYAATMAAYIGLPELQKELRDLRKSVHPAVRRNALLALQTLGFTVEPESPFPGKMDVLPWPEGKGSRGFMSNVQLAQIDPALCEAILVASEREPGKPRRSTTDAKLTTAPDACRFLGLHLNMACAPCYVIAYQRNDDHTCYLFSGGTAGHPVRDFSQGVVLSANGSIRHYTIDWESFHRFALYLVKKRHTELEKAELADEPLLTERDIVRYDWATHTMEMTEEGVKKLPRVGTRGKAFVIVADGQRCYRGAFWTPISSISHPNPVVLPFGGRMRKIERAYPSAEFAKGDDPRSDSRLLNVLKEVGKLREFGPEAQMLPQGQDEEEPKWAATSEWAASEDGLLSIRLCSLQKSYPRGAPFILVAELRNDSKKSVTVQQPFDDDYAARAGEVKMDGPKGRIKYIGENIDRIPPPFSTMRLLSGKMVEGRLELRTWDHDSLDVPGTFQVTYAYSSGEWQGENQPQDYWQGSIKTGAIKIVRTEFKLLWRESSGIPIEKVPMPDGFKVSPAQAAKPIMARSTMAPGTEFYLLADARNYYLGITRKGTKLVAPEPGHQIIDGTTGRIVQPEAEKNAEGKLKVLTEAEARKLAASFANEQLKGKTSRGMDGEKLPPPEIQPEHWRLVERKDGRWRLTIDPPAGFTCVVTMSLDGSKPVLEEAYLALE